MCFFFLSIQVGTATRRKWNLENRSEECLEGKERRLAILQGHAGPSKTGIPAGPQKAWAGDLDCTDEGSLLTNTDPWRTALALRGRSLCMLPCLLLTTHTHTCTYKTDDLFHESDQHCEDMRYHTCFTLCWRNSEKNRIIMRSCLFINGRNILRNYQGKPSVFFSFWHSKVETNFPAFFSDAHCSLIFDLCVVVWNQKLKVKPK